MLFSLKSMAAAVALFAHLYGFTNKQIIVEAYDDETGEATSYEADYFKITEEKIYFLRENGEIITLDKKNNSTVKMFFPSNERATKSVVK